MSRNSWCEDHTPAVHDKAGSTSCARHPVRPTILSLLQTGLVFAVVMTLVVWAVKPAATDEESPAWSIAAGHPRGVKTVAFSPDGRRLATGGDDGCIVVWQVGKGVEKVLSHDRQSMVICVAFSPDGAILASGHGDFTYVLWDVTTGKKRATIARHTYGVSCLSFSPDGTTLATGGGDSTIRLWDTASGKIKATLCGHRRGVSSIRFAPDGRTLASGCCDGMVKLWDVFDGKCRVSVRAGTQPAPIEGLAFAPDGLTLVSTGVCHFLKLWNVATGVAQVASQTEVQSNREVVFSADGQMLIAASYYRSVYLRGLSSSYERTIGLGNRDSLCSAFSPDGLLLAQGDADGTVRVWDLSRAVKWGARNADSGPLNSLCRNRVTSQ